MPTRPVPNQFANNPMYNKKLDNFEWKFLDPLLISPIKVFGIPYYDYNFNLDGYGSHTYDYADVVDLNGTQLGFLKTYSWSHFLPADFDRSMNSVTDAKLWITASGVLCDYSTAAHIEGMGQWVFLNDQDWHWSWTWGIVFDDQTSESIIDLPSSLENYAFWQQNPINVTVGTGQLFNSIRLEQSVLMMDYVSSSPSTTFSTNAVPEPTTFALLGLRMLGIGYMRRRFNK